MRIEMIYTASRSAAKRSTPWAAKIAKVDGGYKAFESVSDYDMWRNQR